MPAVLVHDIPKPGLVLAATEDAFLSVDRARVGAADPARAASVITDFWASC